ncbi:hypothetical protein EDD21DRAFT_123974 [Dissophora ornata]|nr:hypothetical protein EDD21DRAFT_123974 [Dissophora ornata]
MDTPAGLRAGSRSSTYSNYSGTSSNRSSIGQMPAPGTSRLPGTSALKAPSTRLAQPAARSMLTQPKATGSKPGIARPSGLQAPKAGPQVPKSGLQAPRTGLQAPRAGSSIAKPSVSGIAAPGRTGIANSRVAPPSRTPLNNTRPGQIAPPSTGRGGASAATNSNRQSHMPAPSTTSRNGSAIPAGRSVSRGSNQMGPARSMSTPSMLTSPTRVTSGRPSSSYMTSPTSSQSPSSAFPSSRNAVSPLTQRLSNATGTGHLARSRPANRSMSMYVSGSLRDNQEYQQHYQEYPEDDYSFLTPPQSPPSSKIGSRGMGGIPRSGGAAPSRFVSPSVSTPHGSGGYSSMLPRSHTPTRLQSGLLSPRAGRH